MKKFYTFLIALFAFTAVAFAQQKDLGTEYRGAVTIIFGDPIVLNNQSVFIKSTGEGKCSFALYDFKLSETASTSMGDIIVNDITITKEGDVLKFAGHADEVYLTMITPNDIKAKVDISGEEMADGSLKMNIAVVWLAEMNNEPAEIPIPVSFEGKKYLGEQYDGDLVIIFGDPLDPIKQSVFIKPVAEGKCTFALYGFKLNATSGSMGDIVINDVACTKEGDVIKYKGFSNDIHLSMGGLMEINATAELTGEEKANGELSMSIDVVWLVDDTQTMPIPVRFNGKKVGGDAGVENVETVADALVYGGSNMININGYTGKAYVYTLDGRLVKSVEVANDAQLSVNSGLYIVKAGNTIAKVCVR